MRMASNMERQKEEIEAISSICDEGEFFRLPGERYDLGLDIPPAIDRGVLDIKYSNVILKHAPTQPFHHFEVRHLPPASLRIHLPPEYPQSAPPLYRLDIPWLPPWECSLICLRLDELSAENNGCEIIFVWANFLRNDLLSFLNYEESLDVSFLFALHSETENLGNVELLKLADPRARNRALFLHPMEYLTEYDESRRIVVLAQSFHTCGICFDEYSGKKCIEFRDCGHVYCRRCTASYFAARIEEGNVARMPCPDPRCNSVALSSQIREVCPELYTKYEETLLRLTLRTMSDVVVCPRVSCQFPVIVTDGEPLASCRKCDYNFCFYCRKVYHGVAPCVMTSEDTKKLVAMYLEANGNQKKLLVKKYGRRQIQTIVENHLTKSYIKEHTKQCPECRTPTEKTSGCNRMVCVHCRAPFCWICGLRITHSNSYDHFTKNDGKNSCYGRLFEGLPGIDEDMAYLNEIAGVI